MNNTKRLRDLPDVLDIIQLCNFLDISKKTGYKLLREEKIQSIKVGRSYRIPKVHIISYLKMGR